MSLTRNLAVALAIVGCGHDAPESLSGDEPPMDAPASTDGTADAGPGSDTGAGDLGHDAPTSPDSGVDAGADASADSGADSGTDASADSGADSGSGDAGVDAPPTLDMGPDSGTDSGTTDLGGNDAPPSDAECLPLSDDPSAIARNCENPPGQPDPALCPDGYQCVEFFAFIFTYTCEIRCARDCECPAPSTCGQRCDNVGCIDACVP